MVTRGAVFARIKSPAVLSPTEVPQSELTLSVSLQNGDAPGNFTGKTCFAKSTERFHCPTHAGIPPALGRAPQPSAGGGLCPIHIRPCKGHEVHEQSPFPVILQPDLSEQEGGRPMTAGHRRVTPQVPAVSNPFRSPFSSPIAILLHSSLMADETSHQFPIKKKKKRSYVD